MYIITIFLIMSNLHQTQKNQRKILFLHNILLNMLYEVGDENE